MAGSRISTDDYESFVKKHLGELMAAEISYQEGFLDGAYALFTYIEDQK